MESGSNFYNQSGETPVDSAPEAQPALPTHQGREDWTHELGALLHEARLRGDERPKIQIINEWLEFRKAFETPEDS